MYRTRQIRIKKGHRLYAYCSDITFRAARLYNAANFCLRQYATAREYEETGRELHHLQKETACHVRKMTAGTKYEPKGKWLNYGTLDYIFKTEHNRDYYALPSQVNQQMLRLLMRDYKSFFESLRRYKEHPEGFTGRPHMPGYKKERTTAVLTNQICVLKDGQYLKFPKCRARVNLGPVNGRLKEVRIFQYHDMFVIEAVMEMDDCGINPEMSDDQILTEYRKSHKTGRVLSIDVGVNNLMAVTNNFGARPFLVNGRPLKSINQWYNKELARLKSAAEKCNGRKTTSRIRTLTRKRNDRIRDALHKSSRLVTEYAREHGVDLVIMGHNIGQKQNAGMGKQSNQNFVQIPFAVMGSMLRYKLNEAGIRYVETEESYTSKADYAAGDSIPIYGQEEGMILFSGVRIRRGLYRHYDGAVSNADIHAAANIMRKVFPEVPKGLWDRGLLDSPYKKTVA